MKHIKPINRKAGRIEQYLQQQAQPPQTAHSPPSDGAQPPQPEATDDDVVALDDGSSQQQGPPQQPQRPHFPLGCTLIFSPGWEADSSGGTAGLCQPVERDLFDCHLGCFWPAQVPDQLNHAPDWTNKCAAAQKDWRKIDLIFP